MCVVKVTNSLLKRRLYTPSSFGLKRLHFSCPASTHLISKHRSYLSAVQSCSIKKISQHHHSVLNSVMCVVFIYGIFRPSLFRPLRSSPGK
jgi:hypothetical protein